MIELNVHVQSLDRADLPRREKLTILRGQLTLIRCRAEHGIPVSVESIARAEELARGLQSTEVVG